MSLFLQHSPGPEDSHPPPQPVPYFGSYSVSNDSVTHEPNQYTGYLQNTSMDGSMGLLRQTNMSDVNGGSYTHRPLAPLTQAPQMPSLLAHANHQPYRRDMQVPLPRLSPSHPRYASAKRDPTRKATRRRRSSQNTQSIFRFQNEVPGAMEDDGPDEEVTLDSKTPDDLQRLWDVRKKYLNRKGNGMWEDIMTEYLPEEHLSENKKTQVKAALQMKIHRMLLKHGRWPGRDVSFIHINPQQTNKQTKKNEILIMI